MDIYFRKEMLVKQAHWTGSAKQQQRLVKVKAVQNTEIITKVTVTTMIMSARLTRGKTSVAAGNPLIKQHL
jgi:hypothetical protein